MERSDFPKAHDETTWFRWCSHLAMLWTMY